ncbi:MAG: 3'(2'),5'-bisphosphate nucleotidase CysQ [Gammaproteobacteria bacterium]
MTQPAIPPSLLDDVVAIARRAGDAILAVYNRPGDIAATGKQDDSPLTEADLAAHRVIVDGLAALATGWPLLSEEGTDQIDAATRLSWPRYWLVDPLDGTKEFIKRNGEFTVNIALVDDGVPVLGVVHVPVTGVTYLGLAGAGLAGPELADRGAWKIEAGERRAIRTRTLAEAKAAGKPVIVASRSHGIDALAPVLVAIEQRIGAFRTANLGSSLKICLVAEGKADLYPRLGPTSEWDTAAAQAVLQAAGGAMVDSTFAPLRCNTKESLLNPHFLALGGGTADWNWLAATLANP